LIGLPLRVPEILVPRISTVKNRIQKLEMVYLKSALNFLSKYVYNRKVKILGQNEKMTKSVKISCSKNFTNEESDSEAQSGTVGISIKFSTF